MKYCRHNVRGRGDVSRGVPGAAAERECELRAWQRSAALAVLAMRAGAVTRWSSAALQSV